MRSILIIGFLLISRPCFTQNVELTEKEQAQVSKWLEPAAQKYLMHFVTSDSQMSYVIKFGEPPGQPGEVGIFNPFVRTGDKGRSLEEWKLKVSKIIDDQNAIVCDEWWLEGFDTGQWKDGQIIEWNDGLINKHIDERTSTLSGMFVVPVVIGEPVQYEVDGEIRTFKRFIRLDTETAHTLMRDIARNRGYEFYLRESGWSWNQWPLIAKEVNRDFDKVTLETIKGITLEKSIVEFEEKYKKQD